MCVPVEVSHRESTRPTSVCCSCRDNKRTDPPKYEGVRGRLSRTHAHTRVRTHARAAEVILTPVRLFSSLFKAYLAAFRSRQRVFISAGAVADVKAQQGFVVSWPT